MALGDSSLKMGFSAFNEAPELGTFIYYLKEKYRIDTVLETGTHLGGSTAFFATYFDEVHTVELLETYHNHALDLNLEGFSGEIPDSSGRLCI